jgi:hypothetical protein
LNRVYKNELLTALRQKGLVIETERSYDITLEDQTQLFNYLKVPELPVGLSVNFRRRRLIWKRLPRNEEDFDTQEVAELLQY